MPGEGRDFFAALNEARAALRRATLELKEAVNSRDAIKQQIAGEARSAAQAQDMAAGAQAPSELDLRILALEQKLDGLRLTYTEQHPDIVALSRMIEQLKEQKAAEERKSRPRARSQGPLLARLRDSRRLYDQLMVSLATAEANVAAMKARVAEYESPLQRAASGRQCPAAGRRRVQAAHPGLRSHPGSLRQVAGAARTGADIRRSRSKRRGDGIPDHRSAPGAARTKRAQPAAPDDARAACGPRLRLRLRVSDDAARRPRLTTSAGCAKRAGSACWARSP